MKRFHVHVHVEDIGKSIAFYSQMFAAEPARIEADCAKWMLEDPRVNFAISTRGGALDVDHLGLRTDDASELAELKARARAADLSILDEGTTTCCYANSAKHWVTDPRGSRGSTSTCWARSPSSARKHPPSRPMLPRSTPAPAAARARKRRVRVALLVNRRRLPRPAAYDASARDSGAVAGHLSRARSSWPAV